MPDFTITEDFPKSEIEFDQRFSHAQACYEYLFQQKWPDGFECKKCGLKKILAKFKKSLYLHSM